jgi:hypothetical protein
MQLPSGWLSQAQCRTATFYLLTIWIIPDFTEKILHLGISVTCDHVTDSMPQFFQTAGVSVAYRTGWCFSTSKTELRQSVAGRKGGSWGWSQVSSTEGMFRAHISYVAICTTEISEQKRNMLTKLCLIILLKQWLGYGLDCPGFDSRRRREVIALSKASRPAVAPTQHLLCPSCQ